MPQGDCLKDLLENDHFKGDLISIVDIIIQILNTLQYFNSIGVIHRNLNPTIFWINTHNNKLTLLDCSSACYASSADKKIITNLLFSSPEMVSPGKNISSKTDLYSIGVIMYTML